MAVVEYFEIRICWNELRHGLDRKAYPTECVSLAGGYGVARYGQGHTVFRLLAHLVIIGDDRREPRAPFVCGIETARREQVYLVPSFLFITFALDEENIPTDLVLPLSGRILA